MEIPRFRARTVPELLDAAFQVVRVTFWELILVTLIITGPALALQLILPEQWVPLAAWFENVLENYVTAAAVLIVSDAYLGREVSIGSALTRTFTRFGSIFGAAFIRGFLIVLGFLACVVPAFIAMIVTFAMPMAVVLEGASAGGAYERSKTLARDQWGRIVITYVLAFVLALVAAIGLGVVTELAGAGDGVGRLVELLSGVLFAPFVAVVGTLLYYDLRIRKEGFDIQMLATELDTLVPAESPAAGA
jgi:hypothetical protein